MANGNYSLLEKRRKLCLKMNLIKCNEVAICTIKTASSLLLDYKKTEAGGQK